ncbi:hypothetical protein BDP27DRAFT_1427874 [Rhodocollybia butyracea]|uniref:Uncharacterized protein n=1 Tax=Rhodocollybia butyracea TaxID=206335 RepID=A0A9P5U132_9AGAR|nr:hypothetical protein BDP27DRAFT_1427874 [Rhodocollybia butyracea]
MAEQHATHPPVTGTTASPTAESIGQRVQSMPTKPAQWPPVRAHHRAHQEWPPQTETPAATRAPLLTAKDLEGQVTVNNQPVEVIDCPQGEAGDGKRGFCLQDAVDLEQNNDEYACFLSRVRSNAVLARVDLSKTYRQQDPEIISLVCRKTAVDLPYFGKNRFPGYWATREALKQYIKNQRKYQTRLSKAVVSGRKFKNSRRFSGPQPAYVSDGEGNKRFEDPSGDEDLVGLGGNSNAVAGPSGHQYDDEQDQGEFW